jgi:hypothetical protein
VEGDISVAGKGIVQKIESGWDILSVIGIATQAKKSLPAFAG